MIIAVDHGNSNMKTEHCNFQSAYVKNPTMPEMAADWIYYNNDYYALTFKRLPYRSDKSENDDYFILTLFAIAKELEYLKYPAAQNDTPIQLAAGLPPKYLKEYTTSFKKYLLHNGEIINFVHNRNKYSIRITNVDIWPQAYAAIANDYSAIIKMPIFVIVDVGGFTIDTLQYVKGKLDMSCCDSYGEGVIKMYDDINKQISAEYGCPADENEIDNVIMNRETTLPEIAANIIINGAANYTKRMLDLMDKKIGGIMLKPVTFVGGGALLLESNIRKSGRISKITFNTNPNANAQGYAAMSLIAKKNTERTSA